MTGQTQRRRAPDEVPRPADPTAPPPFLDLDDLERRARDLLDPAVFDYYAGGAGTETSLAEAPVAWRTWRLRPRVLRGVTATTATTLLGSAVATPVGVAPWAYQAMAHPEGELATARGAAAAGALVCVSTSATHSVEEVAGPPAGRRGSSSTPSTPPRTPTTSPAGPGTPGTGRWCSPSTCRCWAAGTATCATTSRCPPACGWPTTPPPTTGRR